MICDRISDWVMRIEMVSGERNNAQIVSNEIDFQLKIKNVTEYYV